MSMGTAERREAHEDGEAAELTARSPAEAPDRDIPATGSHTPPRERPKPPEAREQRPDYRPLWTEEPARRRRLPDPVRTAAVRAVLVVALTLILAMVAFLCAMAGSWLSFPMVIGSVAGTVVATWGVLDVWVTRQVWNQRHGVVSMPSSTARAMRRERRRARRQARSAQRAQERIRRRGGAGQLTHS
ncbi:hypothetical protein [Streptomyces lancefieldiae]|uniref:Integral membrane protein n=1 Tax=Streptomyces lancefieldiae TaxID=3075520 RepID=A0ABU3ATA1_9ACTN|nr:hypothetical protein [Streptomyces sp. DSM 40712]MDT0613405.1 hypothetical protein [Streptomyces sp. DSM 40712]